MSHARLAPLIRITGLLRDRDLADLSAAARARQASLDRLAGLEPGPDPEVFSVATARARLRYEAWADQRRAEINPLLARQTLALAEAEDRARLTFGRAEALRRIACQRG